MDRTTKIFGGAALLAVLTLAFPTINAFAQQHGRMGGMMGNQGSQLSQPMMMRTQMLMSMHVNPFDPDAVLSLKDQLKLTDDEVQQLHDVAGAAREKVRALLTDEQKTELEKLEKTPDNSMDMHSMMMKKKHGGRGNADMHRQGDSASSDNCPMVRMMKHMEGPQ